MGHMKVCGNDVVQRDCLLSSGNVAVCKFEKCYSHVHFNQSVGRRFIMYRDEQGQISRDPRTKRLLTRRESLAKPSKHASNSAFAHL